MFKPPTVYYSMLDLETLSTENDAAISAIGLVIFTSSSIVHRFVSYLDLSLVIGNRSLSTISWWKQQDDKVREKVMTGKDLPWESLENLSKIFQAYKPAELWANAPTFDCIILRNQYKAWGIETPWHFREERDYRTLTALAKARGIAYDKAFAKAERHDPLSDAECQALAVNLIRGSL